MLNASAITSAITFIDLAIGIIRRQPSKVIRYLVIKKLSNIHLFGLNFVTHTFLEENRVIKRFEIMDNDFAF